MYHKGTLFSSHKNTNTQVYTLNILIYSLCLSVELGEGPFSVVSAVFNATVFGVNRTSGSVFPLVREFVGGLPPPGLLFNFMITAGLQKDRTSRESHRHTHTHINTSLVSFTHMLNSVLQVSR